MPAEKPTKAELRRAKTIARQIIAYHFGSAPKQIKHLAAGKTNFVFMVFHSEGHYVVRISSDSAWMQAFIKEQWAIAKVRELGVPTPEILEVGSEVGSTPYMISRRVIGSEATFHPERLSIIREMGKYAALINSISTNGFGTTFDWSNNQLSRNESFNDYLKDELDLAHRLKVLEQKGLVKPVQLKKLSSVLKKAAADSNGPRLNHGDLRLKNVMVDSKGGISAIIDWEHCTSNLAPAWELSLALHDLSVDEKQEFLTGYGLSPRNFAKLNPVIKALNLLNYAPALEALFEKKDKVKLDWYRARLKGELDLYSI